MAKFTKKTGLLGEARAVAKEVEETTTTKVADDINET